ncbi:hypothetical protein FXO37_31271 [Capsicum annuum]|nr:hypothetical protein FXO37_31271 [Capsicum annuum]
MVLLDDVCDIYGSGGGGDCRRCRCGTGGGYWLHWLVVFVVAIGGVRIRAICGILQRDSAELPEQSQSGKQTEAGEIYKNIKEGGQGSVDGDEENKSEKEEELKCEKEKEKEDDHQHDDNGSPMGCELISTSQHDPVKTFRIDKFQVTMPIKDKKAEEELTGQIVLKLDPMVELIRKELARATAIRRAVRQGQPNIEALHDQPTKADSGASSGGVVGVGSRHADAATTHDDEHERQLTNIEVYDVANRIMNLDFCTKLKDKYDQHNNANLYYGARFDFLASTLDWDKEEMIKYVRGKRPNPYSKSCTEAKRILAVINVKVIHYQAIEILLEERKINVYNCNEPLIDDVNFFLLVEPLMELLSIMLREGKLMNHLPKEALMKKSWYYGGRNNNMILLKNNIGYTSDSHALAHIECLLRHRNGRANDLPM